MTPQEKQLIDAIKAKPGYQVFPGRNGMGVVVVQTRTNGVKSQSVWLGRRSSVETLQAVLEG